jgi:hypothetical protein
MIEVRTRREEAAAKEVRAAETRYQEALAAERKAREDLEKYQAFKVAEIDRLWQALLGRETSTKGLDEFKESLAKLDRREADFALKVEEAQAKVKKRLDEVEEARQEFQARRRALEKLQRHKEAYLAVEAAEAERLEGLEMEEFTRLSVGPVE